MILVSELRSTIVTLNFSSYAILKKKVKSNNLSRFLWVDGGVG